MHAILAPSSGEIWITCTPSAREALKVVKRTSSYMDEGTLAHKLSELLILRQLKRLRESEYKVKLALLKADYAAYYNKGLLNHCERYCAYVMAAYTKALKRDPTAIILIESKLNLRKYVPESWGTGDVLIMGNGFIWFIDLKYGKRKVEAEENVQLKIYATGAIEVSELFFPSCDEIVLTIYQPHIDNIASWQTTAKEVLIWAKEELIPKAKLAWKGEGEYVAGDHCYFCALKPQCKAHEKHVKKAATKAFQEPTVLSPADIANVLKHGADLKAWITKVEDWALIKAKEGQKFPGYKLVKGKSNRIIKDVKKAGEILREAGYGNNEIMKPREMKGITELEKLLGGDDFYYYLKDVIVKPEGALTLVPESDKRQAEKHFQKATNFFK